MKAAVSVVVPARNAAATLDAQLQALAAQSLDQPWEVVVADNGSTDGTAEVAAAWADRLPGLRVVDASVRLGASAARNLGAAAAGGELLAFCDADDEVAPGWLAALVDVAASFDLVGGPLDVHGLNTSPLLMGAQLHLQPSLTRALGFLPYAYSGNMAIWARVLRDVGGWDESYRNGEDVDLSWRAQLRGYRLGWAPDAVVRYRFPGRVAAVARKSYRFGRAEAQLYRHYAASGMPRSNPGIAARHWVWGLARMPRLAGRDSPWRSLWPRRMAYRAGRLVGSLRHGVLYP